MAKGLFIVVGLSLLLAACIARRAPALPSAISASPTRPASETRALQPQATASPRNEQGLLRNTPTLTIAAAPLITPPLGTSILTLRPLTPTATRLPLTTPWMRTAFPTPNICPTAAVLGIPCPTFIALFGGRQSPFASPTPQPPAPAMTPIASAASLQSLGWSPDGAWLAFWLSASSTPAPNRQPGELAFYNVRQSGVCRIEHLASPIAPPRLEWLDAGQVRVEFTDSTPVRAYQGLPCQPESFRLLPEAPPIPTQTAASPYLHLSLGGEYRAETAMLASQDGVLTFVTRLLPVEGGSHLVEKTWQIDERLGDYAHFLGGEWLSPTQFLVYETLSEGPLILTTDGEALSVLQDLLGESRVPSILDPDGYNLRASAIPAEDPDAYHLLLYGVGVEASFPDVRLYHGEFELVETLPFKYYYAISPDAKWLVMDRRPIIAGYESHAFYIRPLELVDGDWALLAWGADSLAWSADWRQMAYSAQDVLVWQDFPDLNRLGRWQALGYQLTPLGFSPDGCHLAALGVKTPGESLFLLKPQTADAICPP